MIRSPQLKQLDQLINKFCSPAWRDKIHESTTTLSYQTGENIFKEGQKAHNMYMVKKGRVKVYTNYVDNVKFIIRFATDGQTLGHRGFGENFVLPISAVALSDTTINIFPMDLFLEVLKDNNLFCYYFMMFFSEELRRSERMNKNLLKMSVKQRVAEAIRMDAECFGFNSNDSSLLNFTISRRDISALASTAYESVIRTLSDLQSDGIIKLEGKKIRILNMPALKALTIT